MSTTPAHDPTMRAIAQYLTDGLNSEAESYFAGIGLNNQVAVAAWRDWNADLKAITEYPLLMCHRVSGNESVHQGRIEYIIGPYLVLENQPGILNWARLTITRLLREFNAQNKGCIGIIETDITYQIFPKQNERQIWAIARLQFEFEENLDELY